MYFWTAKNDWVNLYNTFAAGTTRIPAFIFATMSCRYHFAIDAKEIKKSLQTYQESVKNAKTLLSKEAYEELRSKMNDPTSLWFGLDPGNRDLFLGGSKLSELKHVSDDPGTLLIMLEFNGMKTVGDQRSNHFNQFVSSLTSYFADKNVDKDWITYMWHIPDEKIDEYIARVNKMHQDGCEGPSCKGWTK